MLLTALALGPGLIAFALAFLFFGWPAALAILAACGLAVVVLVPYLSRMRPKARAPALLRKTVLRNPPTDLPALDLQRGELNRALAAAMDPNAEFHAPPTRENSVARILSRVLDAWGIADTATLPPDKVVTLTLLRRLLTAPPGEAGRIAQMFQRPHVVLGLRDEIDRIAHAREEYDRAFAAYQATPRTRRRGTPAKSLTDTLGPLETADIDLWHHIVCHHDPEDPAQRAAALWCVAQPACDRATVAAYLAQLPDGSQLQEAARNGDRPFLENIHNLIERCNAGYYSHQELNFLPSPRAEARLAAELDALADLTGEARWPDPKHIFVPLSGRAPRPRPVWERATGRIPPRTPGSADNL